MLLALYFAVTFTVALLVTTAYFLLGGLPLLTLKHDEPHDSRFVRSFFHWYYRAAFWTSLGACISYALWGRAVYALGAGLIAALTLLLRKHLLQAMYNLGTQINGSDAGAIQSFRRVHAVALGINLIQLVVVVCGVIHLSRQLS